MSTQSILFAHDDADVQPTHSFGPSDFERSDFEQSNFAQSELERPGRDRPLVPQANFGRPRCPRCGNLLLIAERSEFHFTGWIRNSWHCDDCAHTFETAIALRPR
jgi:hypothetical protein